MGSFRHLIHPTDYTTTLQFVPTPGAKPSDISPPFYSANLTCDN